MEENTAEKDSIFIYFFIYPDRFGHKKLKDYWKSTKLSEIGEVGFSFLEFSLMEKFTNGSWVAKGNIERMKFIGKQTCAT